MTTSILLLIYGLFLISCGITAVIFIGPKAKTALISGGSSGAISILLSYLISQNYGYIKWIGLILSFGLFVVFSWRCTKTLFAVFELQKTNAEELNKKGIAFLLIGLMAIISLFVLFGQFIIIFA